MGGAYTAASISDGVRLGAIAPLALLLDIGDGTDVPEEVSCNLCGSDDARRLYVLRDYRFFVDDLEWPLVQCRRCGLGYLNPRPTPGEIGRYYPDEYFTYRHRLEGRYRRQAEYVPGPPGRLLEVGAAGGDFLALMRGRGWEVEGIERFAQAENAYGILIHRQSFPEECDLPGESFDVIVAWSVFEHLHDPAGAFAECVRLLCPGGLLIVQVPNLRSIHGRIARMEDVPRHLYFFSPRTLAQYAKLAGFRLEKVSHVTAGFSGASGREALRYWLARGLGKSTAEFFSMYRSPRRKRFRTWPVSSAVLAGAGLVGRVLVPDWLVRGARISGQIVAEFRKPGAGAAHV